MPDREAAPGHPRRSLTLTAGLVITAVGLVTLVSLLIATATTIAIRSSLTGQLDRDVRAASGRDVEVLLHGGPPASNPAPGAPGEESGESPDEDRAVEDARAQGPGTLTAYLTSKDAFGRVLTADSGSRPLRPDVLQALQDLPAVDQVQAVDLPGLGSYRLRARDLGDITVVTGLPTHAVDRTVGKLVLWEGLFSATGVLLAGAVAFVVVRRQLRPLREVARTAHEVAGIPLSEGEIGVTARVPGRLTDEHTEVGQVGAALNTLLGHVEQALDERHRSEQQVRQFVADASHELRTPLATIHGYAELSRRARPGTAEDVVRLTQAMGKVEAEADRMSSLVEDLLLLARLDAGRPLARDEVDLTRLVLESAADARVLAPEHRWRLDLADVPVVVRGDEQRLHQVITNLLANARRHTPPGTTVTVGAHPGSDGTSVVVTVHDDGPGIPDELQGSLFERFTRGDAARTRDSGGAGLGLSLARAITAAHGGELAMASRPGSTTFTVTLPADVTPDGSGAAGAPA